MAKKMRVRKNVVVLNRSTGGDIGISIILTLAGLFMFLPMYLTFINAFKSMGENYLWPVKFYIQKPTLQHFIDLFTNMNSTWVPVSRYIFNTVFITIGAVFGCLVFGSLAAYAISKIRMPGHGFIFQLIVYSLMISSTVTGIINFFVYIALGWLNTYEISIIPVWASTLGLYLMKQFIDGSVPDTVIEAARIDGAGEFRIYWQIVMPMVKPAWMTLIITTFQNVWNAGASPYVWNQAYQTFNRAITDVTATIPNAASAGSLIMMSVPCLLFILTQSQIVETMGSSGMKD
ncbi:MAG: carbohydrate ABC transporter permease [Ruminococcaceae bacterium]|nr:carbohydrate ABC transporter permease [Oscillospiraceae bacterium]